MSASQTARTQAAAATRADVIGQFWIWPTLLQLLRLQVC